MGLAVFAVPESRIELTANRLDQHLDTEREAARLPSSSGQPKEQFISPRLCVEEARRVEALRRLGWDGDYITWAHIEAESELVRLKDGKFYVIGANSFFQESWDSWSDLPIHRQIVDEAKKEMGAIRRGGARRVGGGGGWRKPASKGRLAPPMPQKSAPQWRT